MKTIKNLSIITVLVVAVLSVFWADTALAQDQPGKLSQIIIYKGEVAGTGTGITTFKLTVGDEITVTTKGVDENGNDVPIWPTWKADKELSIRVVEGRSKTIVVKALKEGAPLFFSAVYITDDGKKVTGEAMGEVKVK
ncbi:MAG: hypothetical protein Q7T72_01615 [Bacteroidales bacterium]|nr:hypothetical protein [Bacteroidales bacterium]MDP3003458.1 hypothetical protein [Bacteroidales bacterium]